MTGKQHGFGARLRAMREAAGLSQEELAERASLSSHAVSALERGTRTRPYPHTVRALADALGADDSERDALVRAVPSRRPARPAGDAPTASRGPDVPVPATALIGRADEVDQVAGLLGEHRLVTLTGTGGVGKTRLALAVAHQLAGRFVDGVRYVELAPLRDAATSLLAVADAVEAKPGAGGTVAAIAEQLRGRDLLLVLDNVEHVLDVGSEVALLLESVAGLRVLATSRAPLRLRGEREHAVDPLGLPEDDAGPDDVRAAAAVRLLLDRAGAVSPGWGEGREHLAAVVGIARRVSGVPLALELAAARARLLGPTALLDRLDDAMTAGPRDLPERQRTMRATLDWSYGLLRPDEQTLLRLLSVFAGGFRLEELEQLAARLGHGPDALSLLGALAEHSLVVAETADPARYQLLEPVAQYARDRLDEDGGAEAAHLAHLELYLALAEEVAPHFRDDQQVAALARVDAEHANVLAAADRGLAAGRYAEVGRLAWALWMYWWLRGHHAQGRRIAEAALRGPLPPEVQPRVELAAATMSFAMDDVPASREWWSRADRHSADGTDLVARANALAGIGLTDLAVGDAAAARRRFEEAAPLAEAAGPPGEWTAALTAIWLGTVALLEGRPDLAVESLQRGLASARARGDRLTVYVGLYTLSQLELGRGHHDSARRHLHEGIRLSVETGDLANLAYFLDSAAVLEATEGSHARVPLLFGAGQSIREQVGAHGYHYYRPDPASLAGAEAEARRRLGSDRYDDALDYGRGLRTDQAVDLALGRRSAG